MKLIDFRQLRQFGTAIFYRRAGRRNPAYQEFLATFFQAGDFLNCGSTIRASLNIHFVVLIDEARGGCRGSAPYRRHRTWARYQGWLWVIRITRSCWINTAIKVRRQFWKLVWRNCFTRMQRRNGCLRFRLVGKTTIHTETSVDYRGTKHDNTRYAETDDTLMLPDEIRQMPKFRQLLVYNRHCAAHQSCVSTPVYLRKDIQKPIEYRKPEVLRFPTRSISAAIFQKPVRQTVQKFSPKRKNPQKENASKIPVGDLSDSEMQTAAFEKTDLALAEIRSNDGGFWGCKYQSKCFWLWLARERFDKGERFYGAKTYDLVRRLKVRKFTNRKRFGRWRNSRLLIGKSILSTSALRQFGWKQEIILSADFPLWPKRKRGAKENGASIEKTEFSTPVHGVFIKQWKTVQWN